MHKKLGCTGAALIALPLFATTCMADDNFGGSIAVTSDYVLRGLTQTLGDPALQADIHYARDGWVAGIWASTVHINPNANTSAELDIYAGYQRTIDNEWALKATAVHYAYPDDGTRRKYDYTELVVNASYRDSAFITIAWSPKVSRYVDGRYASGAAISYELAGAVPIAPAGKLDAISFNLGIGYYDLQELAATGYWYGNAGFAYDHDDWHAGVSYIATDANAKALFYSGIAGSRWSFTVLRKM